MASTGVPTRHRLRRLSVLDLALVAVVLAIAVTAYLLFFRADEPAAGAARPTVAVARGEVTASVGSSGTLQSSRTASPQFETAGTVTQIMVKVGQVVAAGTAIATIDPAAAERQLRIAEQNQIASANSVDAAQESLTDAQEALESAEEMSASPTPGISQQSQGQSPEVTVSTAEASLARAKADKEQADQEVEAAQAAVTATTLRAPIAGTITAINGSVGSVTGGSGSGSGSAAAGSTSGQGSATGSTATTSTSGTGFVDLADLKSLQVVAAFPEADAIKIKAGQPATVTLNAEPGTSLTASLAAVSPTPTTTNGVVSYSATFSLAKIPANARIGQTANVTVQTAKVADALYVPSTAIATSGTTYTVTLADGGGTREVEVGVRGDSYTQITSGLNEGDRIELLQGTIGTTANQNGRQGQFPGQGQLPGGGVQLPGAGGGNRGR